MASALTIPTNFSQTVDVVDQSGRIINTTKSVFSAFKEAKAAYHARKREIEEERMAKLQRETMKLAAMEKEARRAERSRKKIEHERRKAERKEIEAAAGVKAIEWHGGPEDEKERKKREKREKEKREKEKEKEKEKDKKKHSKHSSSSKDKDRDSKEKKRKGSVSPSSSSSSDDNHNSSSSRALVTTNQAPPSPPRSPSPSSDDDFSSSAPVNHLARFSHHNASMLSLAPQIINSIPGGAATNQIIVAGHAFIQTLGTDSPLSALLLQLTNVLDTLDCLNASLTTLVASLQRDPDALAMVGLTLAEIAAVVAKTAPGVVVAAKAAFPIIFSLLSSPQFVVAAGASCVMIGGYKIICKVTGYGATPAAIEDTPAPRVKTKEEEEEELLAFGPGMHEIEEPASDSEIGHKSGGPKRIGMGRRALTMPANVGGGGGGSSSKGKDAAAAAAVVVVRTDKALPPTPPMTPGAEAEARPKLSREGSSRRKIKSFFTPK